MLDYRHFADTPRDALPDFEEPNIPPASFVFAWPQFRPPYNLSTYSPEPFPGCDAEFAAPCGIQQAIRTVTRARLEACPLLDAGGSPAEAALADITAGAFSPNGTRKFGLVVLLANGTIMADNLRPELVGQPIDGRLASGMVAQPTLLHHIDWAVRHGGGWVPHYTTRLDPLHTWGGLPAPVPAVTYFEACPGGHRLGIALGRKPLPAEENCRITSNQLCAIQNINSILGRTLIDFLSSSSFKSVEEQHYRVSFTEDYTVGTFYPFVYQLSPWGAPGPDPLYNPIPELFSSHSTTWATGGGRSASLNAHNLTDFIRAYLRNPPSYGDWLHSEFGRQVYSGGGWFTYRTYERLLGSHEKLAQVFGVVWNNTGWMFGVGTAHLPESAPSAPRCGECSAAVSLPCAAVTCRRLAAHAQAEMLQPGRDWSRITQSRWFGALQPSVNDTYGTTWPAGFYVLAFDWAGTCVADGSQPANIGRSAGELIGWDVHEMSKLTADNGGGWVPHVGLNGTRRLAFTIKAARAGQFFYLAVAFTHSSPTLEATCSARYAEPCSEQNAHALVGLANAEILAANGTAELLGVLEQIGRRTGAYSPAEAGDFSVQVYDDSWHCVPEAASAGLPCPPAVLSDGLPLLQAAATDEAGSWTSEAAEAPLFAGASGPQRAFVFGSLFAQRGSTERRRLFLVVAVSADKAPPRCGGTGGTVVVCPPNADCEEGGRCKCRLGFRTDFLPNSSSCEDLKPAEMTCTSVSGLDCAAQEPGGTANACPLCGAGHFCPEGAPLACPPGSFCPAGVSQPVPCDAGTYSVAARAGGRESCFACQAGSFSGKAGQTACTACPSGRFTDSPGQSECELCAESTFQPLENSTACQQCEAVVRGATTALLGAVSPEQCLCPEDSYMPLDAAECRACPLGYSCCEGSSLQNLRLPPGAMFRGCPARPSPALLPGHWSDPAEPLVAFECQSEHRCPGGRPGTCGAPKQAAKSRKPKHWCPACSGAHLIGRACAHCEPGFFMADDQCHECAFADKSAYVFPVIPLIFVFVVPGVLYWRMKDPYLKWGNWSNVCTTLMFVLLNHYQMIDIVASTKVKVTSELSATYKSWAITNNLLAIFKTSCTGVTATNELMAIKASAPLLLGLAMIIQMLASRLLAWVRKNGELRLNSNRLFNVYFAILFTFFGAMSAMSLELFKCTKNPEPNDALSLLTDFSIVCYSSDEWMNMLALAIICVIIYVVCVGLVLVRTVFVAKSHFHDEVFRQRWAFLFLKYRLGCWWWGLIFLLKNFCVNISLVLFSSPVWQLHFIQLSIVGYMMLVQKVHPYRSLLANRIEVLSCFSLIVNASVMAGFAFAVEKSIQERKVGIAASVISCLPIAVGGFAVLYLGFYGLQARAGLRMGLTHQARQEAALTQDAHDILDSFGLMAKLSRDGCEEVLRHLGEYERRTFREVDGMLCSELAGDDKTRFKRKTQLSAGELKALLEAKLVDNCVQVGVAKVGGGACDYQSKWAEKVEAPPKIKMGRNGEALVLDSL